MTAVTWSVPTRINQSFNGEPMASIWPWRRLMPGPSAMAECGSRLDVPLRESSPLARH